MSPARLTQNADRGVATVTLVGRGPGNAIDEVMAAELRETFAELDDRDDVVAIVLVGEGNTFCCGSTLTASPSADLIASHGSASAVAAVGKPTLAAIEGEALDQGLELALACDIRVAASTARLGLTQITGGSMPWDGGTQRLPRLIGRSRALFLLLSAGIIGGEEAKRIGLATAVTGSGEAYGLAMDMAATITSHGPLALRYLKEAVYKGADLALDQAMRMEFDLATLLHSTSDRDEGLRAFAERRRPDFTGE